MAPGNELEEEPLDIAFGLVCRVARLDRSHLASILGA